ncbi:MAG: MotA/TolQ/ExbB proton channel family protein [Myxococcota bacterium]|nr:MotA/TolQ/ExbB proton channel family protein [Myxococcota bacterium]
MNLEQALLTFSLLGAGWVLWLLVGLSIACLGVALDRGLYLRLNHTPIDKVQMGLARFLENGDAKAWQAELDELGGLEARVLAAGLEAADRGPASAEESVTGTLIFEKAALEKRLIILGTVGSNAPFIGLFGTVLGIIKAFHDLAANEAEAASAVMAGISEALVATAIGLMVAIPAVVLYNYFQRKNKAIISHTESLSHLVLARLKSNEVSSEPRAEMKGA